MQGFFISVQKIRRDIRMFEDYKKVHNQFF
jgi:hypothetical protein